MTAFVATKLDISPYLENDFLSNSHLTRHDILVELGQNPLGFQ